MDSPSPAAPEIPASSIPAVAPTLAQRLRGRLLQKPRHVLGTVEEARELIPACDAVITESNGVALRITCLVDREANPGNRFGLDRDALARIAAACAKYNAPVHGGTRAPPVICVWEIGPGPLADADRERLSKIKHTFRADLIAGFVDSATRKVWINRSFGDGGASLTLRLDLKALDEPHFDPEKAGAELAAVAEAWARASPRHEEVPVVRAGIPWVSFGLLGLFVAVFVLEHVYAVGGGEKALGLNLATLIALGGVSRPLLVQGEWWRLFTAPLLHGDIFHLLFNGVAFGMAAVFLEQLLGRAWVLAFFAVGALGGSLMSVLVQANTVSVGASGAIMGLFAGAMVTAQRLPEGPHRTQVQLQLGRVLIPSLLPVVNEATAGKIDLAAHFGGALAGLGLGLVILRAWRKAPDAVPLAGFGRLLAFCGALVFAASIAEACGEYPTRADSLRLASQNELDALYEAIDKGGDDTLSVAAAFVDRYPADPRGHYVHAMMLASRDREPEGILELRGALAQREALQLFEPGLEANLRVGLAAMLVDTDQPGEAQTVAAPVCSGHEKARERASEMKLCP